VGVLLILLCCCGGGPVQCLKSLTHRACPDAEVSDGECDNDEIEHAPRRGKVRKSTTPQAVRKPLQTKIA
jgi:hypothetical protein